VRAAGTGPADEPVIEASRVSRISPRHFLVCSEPLAEGLWAAVELRESLVRVRVRVRAS
jgi:hypothetical protein